MANPNLKANMFAGSIRASALPKGWKLVAVGEVLTGTEYGLSEPNDLEGDTPIVGMKDIFNGSVSLTNLSSVSRAGNDWNTLRLRIGDILLNRTNSPDLVGKVGIVRQQSDAVFASYLVRLNTKEKLVDSEYLNAWLNGDVAQRALKRISTRGVSQANINPTEFRRYCPLVLPPLAEQKRIASALLAWNDMIDSAEVLISAKQIRYEAYSRRFFQPCHPSSGEMPGWSNFLMGDLFLERSEQGSEGDILLSITMSGGVIDQAGVGRKDGSNEDKSKYKLILPGDIGYNTMRMWQGVSGLSTLRGIVSPAYTVLLPIKQRISSRYASHLFKSERMIHDFERYSQGLTSDTWNLKYPVFAEIKVNLPPLLTQERQADLLDAMRAEVSALKRQVSMFNSQRRGLMQKLLSGEWRVSC
jgi:type I restriction enzyme S subunit